MPRPIVVKIFIGGLLGSSYEIFSDGFTVRYKAAHGMLRLPETKGETFTPDLIAWKEFREALERINAWDWKTRYENSAIKDGTIWEVVVIDSPERPIISFGENAYPEKFDLFLAAVKRLIGGREFK